MTVIIEKKGELKIEILKKLKESEDNYKKNGVSYTFEESYEKGINFIKNLVSKKNV